MNEDLEKEILAIHERYPEVSFAKLSRICVRIAKWQKQQDQETIELAEDHAMLAGMEKMKEQMMKEAVDAEILLTQDSFGKQIYVELGIQPKQRINGDKVKVIVLKP